jgi:phosphoribosyl 1,2-cyclic phosphodiesterase
LPLTETRPTKKWGRFPEKSAPGLYHGFVRRFMFNIRFWGTRGSLPSPGKDTLIFGGNTSCLELRAGEKTVIIDAGTGIRPLGKNLLLEHKKLDIYLFVTQTHLDHVMGFPMFPPLFVPETKLHIFGREGLKTSLFFLFKPEFWPINLDETPAQIDWNELRAGTKDEASVISLGGGLEVQILLLNHPTPTLGYRFEYEGKSIAVITDHEYEEATGSSDATLNFIKNAGIVIFDAPYTETEYRNGKVGWGHSFHEAALEVAKKAGVGQLFIFHHECSRKDDELLAFEEKHQKAAGNVKLTFAREGMTINA